MRIPLPEFLIRAAAAAALGVVLAGCPRPGAPVWQGYLEGDYVYVAAPLAGRLEKLEVAKGDRVEQGSRLFVLERASEEASQRQASDDLKSANAKLADLGKGSRPPEIAALEARLGQAQAAAELSGLDLDRQASLLKAAAIPQSDYDRARLGHEADVRAADEARARLQSARLGGRADAVAAAAADVQAAAAAEARARWSVDQKAPCAPCAALVFDTLYREGEYVAAGNPVVALLPPANIKVRFFVAEPDFAQLHAGDRLRVALGEGAPPLEARVSYLSPQPEYTPPVLYNRDNRAKLVYMVEAVFSAADARDLHPGQPVDVGPAPR